MNFLILHGFQNHRPDGHWQHWLAERLTALGHGVRRPQLPDPDAPELDRWLAALRRELDAPAGGERVVICHSLAVLLWLHAAARTPDDLPADRVLLVAPPSPSITREYPEIKGFELPELAGVRLKAPTRLVAGHHDPYCPEGAVHHYGAPLGLDTDEIPTGAHLDMEAGYGPWPSLLDWCLDPAVRIGARA